MNAALLLSEENRLVAPSEPLDQGRFRSRSSVPGAALIGGEGRRTLFDAASGEAVDLLL